MCNLCVLQGALVEGYTNKVPKVVVGALDATLLLIRYVKQLHRQAAGAGPQRCNLHYSSTVLLQQYSPAAALRHSVCPVLPYGRIALWMPCRSFGTPAVPVKQLIKDLQPLFESKDVKARDKVKEIVVGSLLRGGVGGSMNAVAVASDIPSAVNDCGQDGPSADRKVSKTAPSQGVSTSNSMVS
jgi:hypothetical protein